MTYQIPIAKQLEPYFKIAEEEANESPCSRRQYGAVFAVGTDSSHQWFVSEHNSRISPCCDGNICIRDRVNTKHGGSVEIGGEIHAETAAVISIVDSNIGPEDGKFILVGYDHGEELLGEDVYPCHSCAIVLKFARHKRIYIRNKNKEIVPISIKEIIDYRIAEWEPVD